MKNTKVNQETTKNTADSDESSPSCQVRRKIEDYLERRRYQNELGDLEDIIELTN